jgi:predicted alpha/beta hydrolase family esterase
LYPLDWDKVKQNAARRICIYAEDDDKVEPARTKELARLIDAELINDPGRGHFAGLHGCSELPSVLESVLSCYNSK